MEDAPPILCYGRAPAGRVHREAVRSIRDGGRTTVAVFPPGARRSDLLSAFTSALLTAGVLSGGTLHFWHHPVPFARFVAAVWPLALMLLFFLGMLIVAYDAACRQVEFEVDGEEIVRLSFGPFGVRRRRWSLSAVADVRVVCHVSGTHSRVVLVAPDGRRDDLLCPGPAGGLREHAEEVAAELRAAIGLAR